MKLAKPWVLPATGQRALHGAIAVPAVLLLLGIAWAIQRNTLNAEPFTGLIMASYFEVFAGVFWLATYLRMACDAQQLRLPGVSQQAALRLIGTTLLLILLPGLAFGLSNGHILGSVLLCAVATLGGLAMGLLPQWLALVIPLAAALLVGDTFAHQRSLDLLDQAIVQGVLLVLAAVLASLIVWRWRVASRHATPYAMAGMPSVFRRTGACRGRAQSPLQSLASWLCGEPDITRTGPQHAVRSVRMALGGILTPHTPRSRWRMAGLVLGGLAVCALSGYSPLLRHVDPGLNPTHWAWLLAYLAFSVAMAPVTTLKKHWHARQTPTTLALLPCLGDASAQRKLLLRACLLRSLAWQALIVLALVVVCVMQPISPLAWYLLLCGQAVALLLGIAGSLDILAGHGRSRWVWAGVIIVSMSLLGFNNMTLPTLAFDTPQLHFGRHLLADAWLLWLTALAIFAAHRWRRFQQRPAPWLTD